MKTPAKRNPLAWMAALLMGVVLWGCKTDRDESLQVTDARLVARAEVGTGSRAPILGPELWIVFNPASDLLIP